MEKIKNRKRFAEIEHCLQRYFETTIVPVMKSVREELNHKQVKELADYQRSPAGILASANPYMDTSWQTIRLTGEWNSKTAEDYLAMCNGRIQNNKTMQEDLTVLADEWRNTVLAEVGQERYDTLSEHIGCDLSFAYIEGRMEDLMVGRMVKEKIPHSAADYIFQKAVGQSIWNLPNEISKSPLEKEIGRHVEEAYRPTRMEKGAGTAIGSVVDAVTLGGIGSWKNLAVFVGSDLILGNLMKESDANPQKNKTLLMESGISKGVFGSDSNVFEEFRKDTSRTEKHTSHYLQTINGRLGHKIHIPNKSNGTTVWDTCASHEFIPLFQIGEDKERDKKANTRMYLWSSHREWRMLIWQIRKPCQQKILKWKQPIFLRKIPFQRNYRKKRNRNDSPSKRIHTVGTG